MWKVTSVQVSTERGAVTTSLGVISRLSASDGWTITLSDREVVAERDHLRLRLPRHLVAIVEEHEPDAEPAKPAKRTREAA